MAAALKNAVETKNESALSYGAFSATAEPFCIRPLAPSHIDAMMALQSIAADNETIPRSRSDLRNHFKRGDIALGVFNGDDTLIAQATIRKTIGPAFHAAANGETDTTRSVLGCVMVHPDYRNRGLMGQLIDQWIDHTGTDGTDDLYARVRIQNDKSWRNFMRKGFEIVATGPSPDDVTRTVHTLHRAVVRTITPA